MATYPTNTYPTSIQDTANPTASSQVGDFDHAGLESFQNDSIEALKTKVGADGSVVTTTHTYKLSGVTGADKAATLAGTETLSSKTLTAPRIANNGFIADNNGNEQIEFVTTASAVNNIRVTNAATANDPLIQANGGDTNISLKIKGKGTGTVKLGTADLQFPNVDGSNGQILQTNAAGVLSWVSPTSGGAISTTSIPKITLPYSATANIGRSVNTAMYFAMIDVPETITVAKVTFWVNAFTAAGTFKIALFSQDGATQLFNLTTASVAAATQMITTSITPTIIPAGKYYLASLSNGTGNYELMHYDPGTAYTNMNFLSGEVYYNGIKTVTASTMPTSFDPTASVTAERYGGIVVRFDN